MPYCTLLGLEQFSGYGSESGRQKESACSIYVNPIALMQPFLQKWVQKVPCPYLPLLLLSVVRCLLPAVYCLLFTVFCLLFAIC
jgi:hypothetical protein